MTGYQLAVQKLRGQRDDNPRRWADAPVPAQIGKRVSEGVFRTR